MRYALGVLLVPLMAACATHAAVYEQTQTKVEPIEGRLITREQDYMVRQMLRRFERDCQSQPDSRSFNFCYAQKVFAARSDGRLDGYRVSTTAASNSPPMRRR